MNGNTKGSTQSISLEKIINSNRYSLSNESFQAECKQQLDKYGVLVIPNFLSEEAVESLVNEGNTHHDKAFFTRSSHNAYLLPSDSGFQKEHPRNREVTSSKGCITTDQIPNSSVLHSLYNNEKFKRFLCHVLNEQALYEYADPLSSINLHYASEGQELGWHFDNSSFAITLLIQKPTGGGTFEFVKDVRDADTGDMNYDGVNRILNEEQSVETLSMDPGCLVLFRGRNSIHRVTPTRGDVCRMLVVLAYNNEPGVSLSESARMTFYGRLN